MMILKKTRGMSSVFEVCDALIPENYEACMLTYNNMNYVPPATLSQVDGNRRLSVKVDGFYTLAGKYGKCIPKMEDVKSLVRDLKNCILELKDYLLDPTNLVIDIRYILFDWQSMKHEFIYVPGCGRDFRDQMKALFEEIMRIYDHQDRQGVVYLYNLYSKFLGENFTPEVFCRLVENDAGSEEQHAFYRPASREDNVPNVSEYGAGDELKTGPESQNNLYNQFRNPSGDQVGDQEEIERFSAIRKADIGLYALVVAAVIVTAFVLMIIFGTGSLKFSILMAVGAIVYIVVDIVQKNEREEQQEIDESMQLHGAKSSLDMNGSGVQVQNQLIPVNPMPVQSMSVGLVPASAVPVQSMSVSAMPVTTKQGQSIPINSVGPYEMSDTSILPGERNIENVSKLVPREKGKAEEIYLIEGETKVGRQKNICDFCLNDSSVSRVHAVFEKRGGSVFVRDAGSTNGTYLNEKRIVANEEVEVNPGDLVGIADIIFECC